MNVFRCQNCGQTRMILIVDDDKPAKCKRCKKKNWEIIPFDSAVRDIVELSVKIVDVGELELLAEDENGQESGSV